MDIPQKPNIFYRSIIYSHAHRLRVPARQLLACSSTDPAIGTPELLPVVPRDMPRPCLDRAQIFFAMES